MRQMNTLMYITSKFRVLSQFLDFSYIDAYTP